MKHLKSGILALSAFAYAAGASAMPAYGELPSGESYITKTLAEVAPLATEAKTIPYTHDFDGKNSMDEFTVITNSGRGWQYAEQINIDTQERTVWGACFKNNYTTSKDGLLITPALNLEAGKEYNVKIHATSGSGSPERLAVWAGTAPTQAAMTIPVIPAQDVWTASYYEKDAVALEGSFIPKTSGTYNVGIWCTSDGNAFWCYVFDIAVTERATGGAPGTPTNFQATADPDGALKVTVKCKAPVKTADGKDLTSLKAVEFLCDNKVVHTENNPAPGADLTFTHDPAEQGTHSYGVVAVSDNGRSDVVDRTLFVGVAAPLPVSDIIVGETETDGVVKLSWTAPKEDMDAKPLVAERLTYKVVSYINNNKEKEFTVVGKNEAELKVSEPDAPQSFRTFGVTATTTGGVADEVMSDPIAVGKADVLPYRESFANGEASHPFLMVTRKYTSAWSLINIEYQAQDGDNGYARFFTNGVNGQADLISGKIDLGTIEHPTLNFWMSGVVNNSPNVLEVLVNGGEGYELAGDEYVASTSAWAPVSVDLSKYAGKKIQIIFRATSRMTPYLALDNISIGDNFDKDLTIVRYDVPVGIDLLATEPMTFTVANIGKLTSDPYKVVLYCNDKEIETQDGPALEPNAEYDFEFQVTPGKDALDRMNYRAEVKWDADENPGNNSTPVFPIYIYKPDLMNVQNVQITRDENGHNVLTWDNPEGASFDHENPYHKLLGFQIFRDGELCHSDLLKENTFVDTVEPEEDTTYQFVTHYEQGISSMSNGYKYSSGVGSIFDDAPEGISIESGRIVVADGVEALVFDLAGSLVANVTGEAAVEVAPGMYIVRSAGKTLKVMIK